MALINVQLVEGGPITQMDEADLVKRTITVDDENEHTVATEYRLKTDPRHPRAVHRSVDMRLKKPAVFGMGVAAEF